MVPMEQVRRSYRPGSSTRSCSYSVNEQHLPDAQGPLQSRGRYGGMQEIPAIGSSSSRLTKRQQQQRTSTSNSFLPMAGMDLSVRSSSGSIQPGHFQRGAIGQLSGEDGFDFNHVPFSEHLGPGQRVGIPLNESLPPRPVLGSPGNPPVPPITPMASRFPESAENELYEHAYQQSFNERLVPPTGTVIPPIGFAGKRPLPLGGSNSLPLCEGTAHGLDNDPFGRPPPLDRRLGPPPKAVIPPISTGSKQQPFGSPGKLPIPPITSTPTKEDFDRESEALSGQSPFNGRFGSPAKSVIPPIGSGSQRWLHEEAAFDFNGEPPLRGASALPRPPKPNAPTRRERPAHDQSVESLGKKKGKKKRKKLSEEADTSVQLTPPRLQKRLSDLEDGLPSFMGGQVPLPPAREPLEWEVKSHPEVPENIFPADIQDEIFEVDCSEMPAGYKIPHPPLEPKPLLCLSNETKRRRSCIPLRAVLAALSATGCVKPLQDVPSSVKRPPRQAGVFNKRKVLPSITR